MGGSRTFLDLRDEVATEDGLRSALRPVDDVAAAAAFGEFVALGPRSTDPDQYAVLIESIREGYLLLARGMPERFVVIDGTREPEWIEKQIRTAVEERLG